MSYFKHVGIRLKNGCRCAECNPQYARAPGKKMKSKSFHEAVWQSVAEELTSEGWDGCPLCDTPAHIQRCGDVRLDVCEAHEFRFTQCAKVCNGLTEISVINLLSQSQILPLKKNKCCHTVGVS